MLVLYCVCHAFVSVHFCLVVTCWEWADLLALVCGVNLCFCFFPRGILGQVWYLIVSVPDPCPFLTKTYFCILFKCYMMYLLYLDVLYI